MPTLARTAPSRSPAAPRRVAAKKGTAKGSAAEALLVNAVGRSAGRARAQVESLPQDDDIALLNAVARAAARSLAS